MLNFSTACPLWLRMKCNSTSFGNVQRHRRHDRFHGNAKPYPLWQLYTAQRKGPGHADRSAEPHHLTCPSSLVAQECKVLFGWLLFMAFLSSLVLFSFHAFLQVRNASHWYKNHRWPASMFGYLPFSLLSDLLGWHGCGAGAWGSTSPQRIYRHTLAWMRSMVTWG